MNNMNTKMNIEFNQQQIEFIINNFKEQLNQVEEEKLTLSNSSQMIIEQIIDKLEKEQ